jgi:hypothetical protein
MKPYLHALVSVKKWGGEPAEYLSIHDFLDSSKSSFPDMRHRAILHSSFGIYICEQVFGHNITLANGKLVSVRDIAEQHVIDDMGRIPTVQDYLIGMPFYEWLGGTKKEKQVTKISKEAPSLDEVKRALQAGAEDMVFDSAAMRLPGKLVVD